MQIAGSNLMIAAQAAQQAARAKPALAPAPKPAEAAGFEPLAFAKPKDPAPVQAGVPGLATRPGAKLDITV